MPEDVDVKRVVVDEETMEEVLVLKVELGMVDGEVELLLEVNDDDGRSEELLLEVVEEVDLTELVKLDELESTDDDDLLLLRLDEVDDLTEDETDDEIAGFEVLDVGVDVGGTLEAVPAGPAIAYNILFSVV